MAVPALVELILGLGTVFRRGLGLMVFEPDGPSLAIAMQCL
jgi:hypothetical protein